MAEITRLSGRSEWIELDFVERERTPRRPMELGIRLHLAGLSPSNTVKEPEKFGVQRSRNAVRDWAQKADVQPAIGTSPNQLGVDETVIRITDQQYWLYAAANPETNEPLHVRLFSTTTTALTEIFPRELRQKHDVDDALSLVDAAPHLKSAVHRAGLRFQVGRHGTRNSVERVFVTQNDEPPCSRIILATSNQPLLKRG